jgi:hypothetical protein
MTPKLDPIRFHANMSSPEARDKLVGISVSSSKDGVVCSLSKHFLLDSDSIEWGLAHVALLEYLLKILHTFLMRVTRTANNMLNYVLKIQEDMLAMKAEIDWEDVQPIGDLIFLLDAYMSAMKFLVNVFCVSHQTHYVDLTTDFAETWFCARDAERKRYEKIFLFCKPKSGSSIFGDRFLIGKKSTGDNRKVAVSQAVLLLNDFTMIINEANNDIEGVPHKTPTEADRKSLHLDNVLFEAFLYSRDLNHFGSGTPSHVLATFQSSRGMFARGSTRMNGKRR